MSRKKPIKIFINYRWRYSYLQARDLHRTITATFEDVDVFRDEDDIEKGESLKDSISTALEECDLILTLLHSNWLQEPKIEGGQGLKLRAKECWIRQELDTAHNQLDKPIWAVLYDNAVLPHEDDLFLLPPCLSFLSSDLNSFKIARNHYKDNLNGLLTALETKFQLKRKPKTHQKKKSCLEEDNLQLSTELPDKKIINRPYRGLSYYEEQHARLFFGRSNEICELWDMVVRKIQPLTLLYGYSGVGKSSLLNAGLFPRLKQKRWQVIAERRKSDTSLKDLFVSMLEQQTQDQNILLVIDQLEEALIKPFKNEDELIPFFDKLHEVCLQSTNLKILLGFRKEFLPEIKEQINRLNLSNQLTKQTEGETGFFLQSLTDEGLMEALQLNEDVKQHFDFAFEEGLEDQIAASIVEPEARRHAIEASNKAPWLQLLLSNLWETARNNHNGLHKLQLTKKNFEAVRQNSFSTLVEHQLAKMENAPAPHHTFYENGFTLDLLYQLTTTTGTAAMLKDDEIIQRYAIEASLLIEHIRLLEEHQLIIRVLGWNDQKFTRLAHDSLASVIRDRFEESNKPVQRANRIFSSKKTAKGTLNPIHDREDLRILELARPYMYRWSALEVQAYEQGKQKLAQDEAILRDKNALIFETLASDAQQLIKSLDHALALPKLEAALGVEIPTAVKQEQLAKATEELLCFFTRTGQHPEEARKAAALRLQLPTDETTAQLLKQSQMQDGHAYQPLLERLPHFSLQDFNERYLPTMLPIAGDTFQMGGKVEWTDPSPGQQNNTIHSVEITDFKLAHTPFTFYQYSLHCAATQKSVAANTPPWGRNGDCPLVLVSWYETIEIINWLSTFLGKDPYYELDKTINKDSNNQVANDNYKYLVTRQVEANGFRLPTEAEWEYAARGGIHRRSRKKGILSLSKSKDFPFAGSDQLHEVGWYWKNSGDKELDGSWSLEKIAANNGRAQPVALKKHNELDLYDMSGNVFEWCWDWFDWEYYDQCKQERIVRNPAGSPGSSLGRVLRGGSWFDDDDSCQVAIRSNFYPNYRDYYVGFRLSQD